MSVAKGKTKSRRGIKRRICSLRNYVASSLTLDLFVQHSARLGRIPVGTPALEERFELFLFELLPTCILDRLSDRRLSAIAHSLARFSRANTRRAMKAAYRARSFARSLQFELRGDPSGNFIRSLEPRRFRGSFGNALEVTDLGLSTDGLRMSLVKTGYIEGPYRFYIHLSRADDPKIIYSLDCDPAIPFMTWPNNRWTYQLRVPFTGIPAGTYKVRVGIYEPLIFTKLTFRLDATIQPGIDVGEVHIPEESLEVAA